MDTKKPTVHLYQEDANTCRAPIIFSKEFVSKTLEYKTKIPRFNPRLGRKVMKTITATVANRRYNKGALFPAGLMPYMIKQANMRGHVCNVDAIEPFPIGRQSAKLKGIIFDPFQAKMLKSVNRHDRGILVGPTAMGKSIVLGGILSTFKNPITVVITPTQTIFNQLYESFSGWFGKKNVGKVGQGIQDQQKITICMYQSLKKYKLNAIIPELILVDECHLLNNTMIKFFNKCPNTYYRYGVTATPQKLKNDFLKAALMYGYLGPILTEVKAEKAKKRVLPVEVKMVTFVKKRPLGQSYQDCLHRDILFSRERNRQLIQATRKYALDKGLTALFLLDEINQGEIVYQMATIFGLNPVFVHGKLDSDVIQDTIKKLNARKINFVIATKVFGVGTNIPNVDCVTLGAARKSEIDLLQKIGRGRRKVAKTDSLIVIDSMDELKTENLKPYLRDRKYFTYFKQYSNKRKRIYRENQWPIEQIIL